MYRSFPSSARDHFDAMYARHYRHILAYCGRRLPSAEALDAVSDTFLVAWRRLDDVPPGPAERPWLYGVARRVVANHHRSATRRRQLVERVAGDGKSVLEAVDAQVLRAEADQEVIAALDRLGEVDREIVLLRLWEELTHLEIAEIVGMSDVAVRKRLSRARRRLQRLLQVDSEPEEVLSE